MVRSHFDAVTLERARSYLHLLRDVQAEEDEPGVLVIFASVLDAESNEVELVLDSDTFGLGMMGLCTCPVTRQCEHSAALALSLIPPSAAGRAAEYDDPRGAPMWELGVEALLGALSRDRAAITGGGARIGIQFNVTERKATRFEPASLRVTYRPVQRDAKGKWSKSGVSWQTIRDSYGGGGVTPEQRELLSVLRASAFESGYYSGNTLPDLPDARVGVWGALARAVEHGIELVPGSRLERVELHPEQVLPRMDAVAAPEGGVYLRAGIDLGEHFVSGADLQVLGERPHGVAVFRPGARRNRLVLHLVQFERSLEPDFSRVLRGDGIAVPAADRERFAEDFLPRVARLIPVSSADDSVRVVEPEPPRLTLCVQWQGATGALLQWRWRYWMGERDREFEFGADDGWEVRSPAAEADLLAALAAALTPDRFGRDLLFDDDGALFPWRRLQEFEVVLFAGMVLPELRALVEVDEVGEQTEFRELEGAPTFSFDLDEGGSEVDWLDLRVRIEVAGESVPLADVLAALTEGAPLMVLPNGRYLRTDVPEFARLAELVGAAAQLHESDGDRMRVGRTDLGLWGALDELGVVDSEAAEWVAAAKRLQEFTGLPEIEPVGVASTLREYQLTGFRWLAYLWETGLGGVLADDMGLGKTLQTLAFIAHARAEGAGPFLVVAPTSVVSGWKREAETHTPALVVRTVEASAARRGGTVADLAAGADVLVTSYTLFRLEAEQYQRVEWGGMILDEAQAIKNHQGKTYHAVRRLSVPFRLAVTGTPFENRLMELWSLLSVVAPGLYPRPAQFTELVVRPVEKEGDQEALARLRRRIRPFLLRRTKELVAADLPPKQEQILDVELGAEHRTIYDTHLQRERQTVLGLVDDFDRNRVAIFAAITRMRMLSLDPALVDEEHADVGSAKIDALVANLLELAEEGHRALVFSQFTTYLARVKKRLDREGIRWVYLDGRTRDRAKRIAEFKDGDAPVFLISLKAGGVGLTLTEADYVFVLDPWWNPAVEAQAVDRAHRIGQTRSVNVYRMVAQGTIEGKVMELKERKAALFDQVVGGAAGDLAGLAVEDVRGLFE